MPTDQANRDRVASLLVSVLAGVLVVTVLLVTALVSDRLDVHRRSAGVLFAGLMIAILILGMVVGEAWHRVRNGPQNPPRHRDTDAHL